MFYIENDKIMEIGGKLNEINEDAFMNVEGRKVLLEAWLEKNDPDILEGLDADPEAGLYAAYYCGTSDEQCAHGILITFILCDHLRNNFSYTRKR